jgi:hypothetical protein
MREQIHLRTVRDKDRSAQTGPGHVSQELERRWFRFDRDQVLQRIDSTHEAVDGEAKELQMVAKEGVFRTLLSRELLRKSRMLNAVARQLTVLRRAVARARAYPKTRKMRP